MAKPPRVVLDTNTVLSALVFPKGQLAALREMWQREACCPLVSRLTVAELVRVLAYPKFKLDPEQQGELLGDYLPYANVIRMPPKPPRTPACRDPADVPFLQLALVGKADYLVSGDSDLLEIGDRLACAIVSPAQFLESMR